MIRVCRQLVLCYVWWCHHFDIRWLKNSCVSYAIRCRKEVCLFKIFFLNQIVVLIEIYIRQNQYKSNEKTDVPCSCIILILRRVFSISEFGRFWHLSKFFEEGVFIAKESSSNKFFSPIHSFSASNRFIFRKKCLFSAL